MKILKLLGALMIVLAVTGCAVGNTYDYEAATVSLPVKGNESVGLGVIDNRSYVLSGDKKADFIGLQRGGFNNPFDVRTASGKPMTEDMQTALSRALDNSGFDVKKLDFSSSDSELVASVVASSGEEKNIVLTVTDWKTDVFMNITLFYDLLLEVYEKDGAIVATNRLHGKEGVGGGGFESQNSRAAASAFETKIGRLFNSPDIIAALK